MKNSVNFSHLVEIDEGKRVLTIYRVFDSGEKSLYTSSDMPEGKDSKSGAEFARTLGENLLLDSPAARRILGW
jgi:hypothetical protein